MSIIDTTTGSIPSRKFFDGTALVRVCEAEEHEFEAMYDMTKVKVDQPGADFYLFRDNGSSILAVAHLDTVGLAHQRKTHIVDTEGGTVVYSRALDDRLGAYVLAELLPAMGMRFDLLLTVGEETGQSTAQFFDPSDHHDRTYNWIIEFDRGGTDVVLYQYEDSDLIDKVTATGADVEQGIFSDISYMEHVGVKALNWGVGYRDYHGPRAHVWLDDMFRMVDYFCDFHETWADTHMPHESSTDPWYRSYYRGSTYSGGSTSTADESEHSECGEFDSRFEDCHGAMVDHSTYGPFCEYHLDWYLD